jgi:hypothetical protein
MHAQPKPLLMFLLAGVLFGCSAPASTTSSSDSGLADGAIGGGGADAGPPDTAAAADASSTCAMAGGTCATISDCGYGVGHIANSQYECSGNSVVCCLPQSACGEESFACCSGTNTFRPLCGGGSLACGLSELSCGANTLAPSTPDGGLASLCAATGGAIGSAYCCSTVNDFAGTCLSGACQCPTGTTNVVSVCVCPEWYCFDPNAGCYFMQ